MWWAGAVDGVGAGCRGRGVGDVGGCGVYGVDAGGNKAVEVVVVVVVLSVLVVIVVVGVEVVAVVWWCWCGCWVSYCWYWCFRW